VLLKTIILDYLELMSITKTLHSSSTFVYMYSMHEFSKSQL